MGPNGAGKTTAFNAITGIARLASGSVRFEGVDVSKLRPHEVAARGIRRTFQNNGILNKMTVLENVLAGLELSTRSSLAGVVLGLRSDGLAASSL
jgi:branched-chain amino acid transport system ATP-binding protein